MEKGDGLHMGLGFWGTGGSSLGQLSTTVTTQLIMLLKHSTWHSAKIPCKLQEAGGREDETFAWTKMISSIWLQLGTQDPSPLLQGSGWSIAEGSREAKNMKWRHRRGD